MKWLMVVLAVLVAIAVGIYVLDVANLIDVKAFMINRLTKWSVTSSYLETYRLGLEEENFLQERKEELTFLADELATKEQDLVLQQEQLYRKQQELDSLTKNLERDKLALEQQRTQLMSIKSDSEKLKVEATLLSEMETKSILAILDNLPEDKQISLLANMDQDIVTNLLESMEAAKAAQLLPEVSKLIEGR
ncbi:MAG: hypothetical protein PHI65_03605 [Firmicutes bacterium]|nr:hypothetical protein [Bacillota bacterium]